MNGMIEATKTIGKAVLLVTATIAIANRVSQRVPAARKLLTGS